MSAVTQDKAYYIPLLFNKTVTADREDTNGYADIYSSGPVAAFIGATLCGLAATQDYSLKATINGTLRVVDSIDIKPSDDWDGIAGRIQTSLRTHSGALETVVISGGKIKVTSATTGLASTVSLADGTTLTPLIAAIEALSGYSAVTIDAAVAGTAGTKASHTGTIDVSTGHNFSNYTATFTINVDSGGIKTITLNTNCADLAAILAAINAQFVAQAIDGNVEAVASGNFVRIQFKSTGAHSIVLADGTHTPLVSTFGMAAGTYNGIASSAASHTGSADESTGENFSIALTAATSTGNVNVGAGHNFSIAAAAASQTGNINRAAGFNFSVALTAANHVGTLSMAAGHDFSIALTKAAEEGSVDLTAGYNFSAGGPYTFTINADSGGSKTINMSANDANRAAIMAEINNEFVAQGINALVECVAGVGAGHILIRSKTAGSAHRFILADGAGVPLSIMGIDPGTYIGTNSTAADFTINADGAGAKTINLAAFDTNLTMLLAEINAEFVTEGISALVEAVASGNYVKIQSKTSGAAHNFILVDGTNTPLVSLFGMTAATYTGTNSTAADFTINVDGGGAKTIHLVGNDANLAALLVEINAEFTAEGIAASVEAVASGNFLKIQWKAVGSAHNFILIDGTNTPLVSAFGMTAGTYTGVDATTATVTGNINCTGGHDFVNHSVDFSLNAGTGVKTINLASNDVSLAGILSELNTEFTTEAINTLVEAVADATGKYVVLQRKAVGAASIVLVDGSGTPLVSIFGMTAGTYTGTAATAGYQTISCTETFVGATVPAMGSYYTLNVDIDGSPFSVNNISIAPSSTWTDVVGAIEAAIQSKTASTEVCNITNARIRITSAINGGSSTVVITEGTGGRPLLAAITALADYTAVLGTPVDGRDGAVYFQIAPTAPTTLDFYPIAMTVDSASKEKAGAVTGLKLSYSKTTGMLAVLDDADAVEIKSGDVVTVIGHFA